MKISQFATAALFASVLAASAQVTFTVEGGTSTTPPTLPATAGSTAKLLIKGLGVGDNWTATESATWLSISSAAGVVPPSGTVELTLTALTEGTTSKQAIELVFVPKSTTPALPAFNIPIFQEAAAATTTTTTTATDTAAPTLTITAGSTKSVYQKAVISGTATDTGGPTTGTAAAASSGVQQVYWRDEGSSKWRKAMMGGRGTASATWFINTTLKKKAGRRIYIKAVDGAGNESMITDRFKWDTTGTTTTTTPTTPTTPTVTTGG